MRVKRVIITDGFLSALSAPPKRLAHARFPECSARTSRLVFAPIALLTAGASAAPAQAQEGAPAIATEAPAADVAPPTAATQLDFLQYGAVVTAEGRLSSGDICPAGASAPCILGGGGGIGIRVGWRSHEGYFLGGAYEFSKHDAANLLNLPILQQLRAEGRYYFVHGTRLSPYGIAGSGVAAYGNQWAVETYGYVFTGGVGVEYESTREVFAGLAFLYRAVHLHSWDDKAGQYRPGGFANFLGVEITLEARSPFARW